MLGVLQRVQQQRACKSRVVGVLGRPCYLCMCCRWTGVAIAEAGSGREVERQRRAQTEIPLGNKGLISFCQNVAFTRFR